MWYNLHNFKLDCFALYAIAWQIQERPSLELKTQPILLAEVCPWPTHFTCQLNGLPMLLVFTGWFLYTNIS
jgi:hypothetical protein